MSCAATWALRRSVQFGRGQFWLDIGFRRPARLVAGMPRWPIRRIIEQTGCVTAAWVRRNQQSLFLARRDLGFLRGVLAQAWRVRHGTDSREAEIAGASARTPPLHPRRRQPIESDPFLS
jgi:hypothetical protein